jgi:hypothetical protein
MVHSLLAIVVPFSLLSSYSTAFELEHALRLSHVTRLFVGPKLVPLALRTANIVGIPQSRIYVFGGRLKGKLSFDDLVDNVRTHHIPRIDVRPAFLDTLAYLVFSSGTSGLPKGLFPTLGDVRQLSVFSDSRHDISWKYCFHAVASRRHDNRSSEGVPCLSIFIPLFAYIYLFPFIDLPSLRLRRGLQLFSPFFPYIIHMASMPLLSDASLCRRRLCFSRNGMLD